MNFLTLRTVCRSTAWSVCLFVFVTGSSRAIGAAVTDALLPQKPSAKDSPGSEMLIRVTEHGTPRLTRYQRVIVEVKR